MRDPWIYSQKEDSRYLPYLQLQLTQTPYTSGAIPNSGPKIYRCKFHTSISRIKRLAEHHCLKLYLDAKKLNFTSLVVSEILYIYLCLHHWMNYMHVQLWQFSAGQFILCSVCTIPCLYYVLGPLATVEYLRPLDYQR